MSPQHARVKGVQALEDPMHIVSPCCGLPTSASGAAWTRTGLLRIASLLFAAEGQGTALTKLFGCECLGVLREAIAHLNT